MAPRTGCFLLPLLFIASSRVVLVHADCTGTPADACKITAENLCVGCVTPGGSVPNPKDCASFYYCLSETDMIEEPFSCPDGQIIDMALLECIPDDGSCTPGCPGGGGGDGGKCFYTCDGATEDVIADPFDC
ncbi:uncharacterized protein LOC123516198, partial [Portunus trituberculatus]|uniref:uncharacterized protein LOC123516198 n=1 Tax=Portunus trituberculatus TaxID=210409 RepID=UPI001E1CC84C